MTSTACHRILPGVLAAYARSSSLWEIYHRRMPSSTDLSPVWAIYPRPQSNLLFQSRPADGFSKIVWCCREHQPKLIDFKAARPIRLELCCVQAQFGNETSFHVGDHPCVDRFYGCLMRSQQS